MKPDGVQRGLVGEIIGRFERKGFTLRGLKLFTPEKQLAEEHYKDLSQKPFFKDLVDYITSGPVVAMVRGRMHVCMHITSHFLCLPGNRLSAWDSALRNMHNPPRTPLQCEQDHSVGTDRGRGAWQKDVPGTSAALQQSTKEDEQ